MEEQKPSPGIVDRIWKFFTSITLAVVIFAIISLASIVGTIIEQGAEPERNIAIVAKIAGKDAAPGIFRVLDALGFTNMFSSWWFTGLLLVFAANLVICSIERLPRIWKLVKQPIKPLLPEHWSGLSLRRDAVIKGASPDKTIDGAIGALKKIGYGAAVHREDGNIQLYAEKGRYSRLGVYVTHLSILLILLGALVGLQFGFNGHLNLLEGDTSSVAMRQNGQELPLGFEIRCDDFEVAFYPGSDTPKDFRSWLTVIENGKEVARKEITVNDPLRHNGITFYQSSYGFSPSNRSRFRISVITSGGKTQDFELRFGESFTLPGTNITGTIADFSPALGVDNGRFFTYADSMNNPAVFIQYTEGGKPKFTQWALKRYPETWNTPVGTIEFRDLWAAQYTGLQVRKDPGVWIVYLGCIVMAIGLYAAFFMSHSRVWISLASEKNATRVSVAASINKNRLGLERKLDLLMQELTGRSDRPSR